MPEEDFHVHARALRRESPPASGAQLAMPPGEHATLVSIPLVEPAVTRTVGLIRRRGYVLSPAAQQLYDMFLAMRPARRTRSKARATER